MNSHPEGDVAVAFPRDVHVIGVLEHLRITVRSGKVHQDLVADVHHVRGVKHQPEAHALEAAEDHQQPGLLVGERDGVARIRRDDIANRLATLGDAQDGAGIQAVAPPPVEHDDVDQDSSVTA